MFNVKDNLKGLIQASLNVLPVKGKYIFYKHVKKDLTSLHDSAFKYKVGKTVTCKDVDLDWNVSCGKGLHVSTSTYWQERGGEAVIACEVDIKDIITCQDGKVRCKKLKVLEVVQDRDC